ncbi:MAG: response regulator transcription factor [Gammaproteobacteria bacterium]
MSIDAAGPGTRTGAVRHVLLVAANRIAQTGYRAVEEADPSITFDWIAASTEEALRILASAKPDLLLVDLTDDRLHGTQLIHEVVAAHPAIRVLAVSAREDLIEAEVALQGGAGGYVCRSAALEEIIKAMHLVADGSNYLDPALAQRIALQKLMGKSSNLRGLSPREYEVFCMLAADVPLKEIARLLNLSYKTVANYGGTIKAKLKLSTREDLRALARRTGVIPG